MSCGQSQQSSTLAEQIALENTKQQFLGGWFRKQNEPKHDEKIEVDLSDIEFEKEDLGWGGVTRPRGFPTDEEFQKEEGWIED